MEHTYIEQFEKEFIRPLGAKDLRIFSIPQITDDCKFWAIENITEDLKAFIQKVRTETLMECRGLMPELTKEDRAFIKEEDPRYMGEWGVLAERDRMFAAIDTLIKKETV